MGLGAYLRSQRRWIRGGWNRFWFQAQDPTLVGIIRVVTGLMLVYSHLIWGAVLFDFFGQDAWLPPELIRELQTGQFHFSYLWWISDDWLVVAHGIVLVPLVLFACGYKTRVTSFLAVIIHISYARRQPAATFGLDQVLAFVTLYLAYGFLFTPARQRALSLDRLFWRRSQTRGASDRVDAAKVLNESAELEHSHGAHLTLRLMQIQMCVVYFFAGISKLQGESWWNGEAMWLAFSNEEYANSLGMLWTSNFPTAIAFLGHVTVLWELSFAALVWNKTLRPSVLTFGLLMHLGIGLCLSMWTFGIMMIVGCCSFLPPERIGNALGRWNQHRKRANAESAVHPGEECVAVEYPDSDIGVADVSDGSRGEEMVSSIDATTALQDPKTQTTSKSSAKKKASTDVRVNKPR